MKMKVFIDYASGIWLPDSSKLAVNLKKSNDVTVFRNDAIVNWRLGQVRNTKFGKKVSSKMLLNAAKCQGHSFNRF